MTRVPRVRAAAPLVPAADRIEVGGPDPDLVGHSPILRPVMPELDVVRGLAVLLVLFYHGFFWSSGESAGHSVIVRFLLMASRSGWLGVELFFVLSGFLITNILLGTRDRHDYYRRFYLRRSLRIVPAYVALIVLLLALGMVGWRFAVVSSLFLANVSTYLGVPMQYGPLWSLAVEEHFYLAWPAAVRHLNESALAIVAGAVILIEPVVRFVAFELGAETYGPSWLMLDGLAFGALLALVVRRTGQDRRALMRIALASALLGVTMFLVGLPVGLLTRSRPLGAALQLTPFYLVATGAIGSLLLVASGPRRRFVRVRALAFLGQISYGLYLIHLAVFHEFDLIAKRFSQSYSLDPSSDGAILVRFAICAAVSVLVAYVSRWTFEEYFLRLKDRGGKQRMAERAAIASPSAPDQ